MTAPGRLIVALAFLALVAGCTGQGEQPDSFDGREVRVFGNYRGLQAEDFRLVLDEFTARTGIKASYVGTANFAGRIQERVRDGDPPDVALFPQPAILADLAEDGFIQPLSNETEAAVEANYPDGVLEVMRSNGTLYGVWYRASVKSLVWYPPERFAELGYSVPTSWEGLLELTDRMADDGHTPWCLGMEAFGATGWVGTDWIEDIVLRFYGPAVYDQWVAGDISFTDPRIQEAFQRFGDIALRPGWVVGGTRGVLTIPAMRAIDPMLDDPPGCLMTRQGSFQIFDLPPETATGGDRDLDFFVLPPPESGLAPILAAGEIAATFTGTTEAHELLAFLATPEAAKPWADAGGFTSPQSGLAEDLYASDFDRRVANLIVDAEVVRFDGSDLMPPEVGTGTFWDGVVDYMSGSPLPDVLLRIQDGFQ